MACQIRWYQAGFVLRSSSSLASFSTRFRSAMLLLNELSPSFRRLLILGGGFACMLRDEALVPLRQLRLGLVRPPFLSPVRHQRASLRARLHGVFDGHLVVRPLRRHARDVELGVHRKRLRRCDGTRRIDRSIGQIR